MKKARQSALLGWKVSELTYWLNAAAGQLDRPLDQQNQQIIAQALGSASHYVIWTRLWNIILGGLCIAFGVAAVVLSVILSSKSW